MLETAGQPFNQTLVFPQTLDVVKQSFVTATTGASGYTVNQAGPNSLILTRRFIPLWAIIVAIVGTLLFLIGLLALLIKSTETLTITLTQAESGTRVTISGAATQEMVTRLNSVISGAGGVPTLAPPFQPAPQTTPAPPPSAPPPPTPPVAS